MIEDHRSKYRRFIHSILRRFLNIVAGVPLIITNCNFKNALLKLISIKSPINRWHEPRILNPWRLDKILIIVLRFEAINTLNGADNKTYNLYNRPTGREGAEQKIHGSTLTLRRPLFEKRLQMRAARFQLRVVD